MAKTGFSLQHVQFNFRGNRLARGSWFSGKSRLPQVAQRPFRFAVKCRVAPGTAARLYHDHRERAEPEPRGLTAARLR